MSRSNSQSESSNSSPNQTPFCKEHTMNKENSDCNDLTLFGSPAPTLMRSGTVRRVSNSNSLKQELELKDISDLNDDADEFETDLFNKLDPFVNNDLTNNCFRKSMDSTFRHSLESISENGTKRSFPSTLTPTNRNFGSLESISSDKTDYAMRSATENKENKTIQSPGSSYLTWIESASTDYVGSAPPVAPETTDIDSKVGEWNNFWLNYNSARGQYLTSPYISLEDKRDDISEVKSTCSTQKELIGKNSGEHINLSLDEAQEVIRCSTRITEIFQNALSRNDHDYANSNHESSYYSENFSHHNTAVKEEINDFVKEDLRKVARERSKSYITAQELIKRKEMLKPSTQSSSTSCINAILNTGVADILKRVINKRRDVMSPDDHSSVTRHSFSEWSSK